MYYLLYGQCTMFKTKALKRPLAVFGKYLNIPDLSTTRITQASVQCMSLLNIDIKLSLIFVEDISNMLLRWQGPRPLALGSSFSHVFEGFVSFRVMVFSF